MNPEFFTTAKTEHGDSGNDPTVVPQWVDREKLRQGKNYYRKYFFSVYISCMSALCAGFCIPSLLTVLVFTGKSESVPKLRDRYLRVIHYMDKWYREDIWNQNGEAFRNLLQIRKTHTRVAKQKMASDVTSANGTVAISQYDMVLAQLGFMGFLIIYPTKFGVKHSESEVEGLIHLWRYIGYLLGIDEKYNLCAGTHTQVFLKCQQLLECVLKPNLCHPPPDYEHMARGLMIALRPIIPGLDYDYFGPFVFQILDVPFVNSNNSGPVTKTHRVMPWLLRLCCNWLLFTVPFRLFFNWALYSSVQRAQNLHQSSVKIKTF